MDTFFEPQHLIIDITLCGEFLTTNFTSFTKPSSRRLVSLLYLCLSASNSPSLYISAGNPSVFAQTCSGTCYNTFVIGPPSNYDNAYFEIKNIRTYHDPSVTSTGAAHRTSGATLGAVTAALLLLGMVGMI